MHDIKILKINGAENAFLNRREWRTYMAALQSVATSPKVADAVKSGCNWFSDGATHASNWLVGADELGHKLSPG